MDFGKTPFGNYVSDGHDFLNTLDILLSCPIPSSWFGGISKILNDYNDEL